MIKKLLLLWLFSSLTIVTFSQTGLIYTSSPNTLVLGQDNTPLDITQGTIEAWIKTPDAGNDYRGIIVKHEAYGIYLHDNEFAAFDWQDNVRHETNINLADDQWHHVALVFDDSVTNGSKLYVDGQSELTFTYYAQTSNKRIVTGKGHDSTTDSSQQFNGQIDNVRVWNTVRTDTEILNSYNKCLTGTENGLVMLWQFEEGTGTAVSDVSGNGNTGTLYNMNDTNWVTGYDCKPMDLVAYYPFNNNANDESGNGNHGTINEATFDTDRFGNSNSTGSFNGINQYITIPNNPNINIAEGESYSISFWVKHNAQNNGKYMISNYNVTFGTPCYAIGTGSNGDSYSWYEFSPSNGQESRGNIDLNDNQWHNITSVFKSGESVTIYVDGELDIQHSTSHIGSITNTRDLTIGCGANIAQFYNGLIDDIKIYKKALTIEEIKSEANNLVAYYPFNGNANDESGSGNHGIINGVEPTDDRFGDPNSAYLFEGNDIITIPHDTSLNMENELSISVWVRPTSSADAMILGKSNYSSTTNYLMRTTSAGYISFEYKNFANSNTLPLTTGNWNHIVAISKADDSKEVYINGALATHTTASSPSGLVTNDLTIGARNGAEYFNGSIDDLRIYKSVLSPSEVSSLFLNNSLKVENYILNKEPNFYISNSTLHFKDSQNLAEIKSIEVYNLLGQKVFETSKIETKISIDNLRNGIFIALVKSENSFKTLKFITN